MKKRLIYEKGKLFSMLQKCNCKNIDKGKKWVLCKSIDLIIFEKKEWKHQGSAAAANFSGYISICNRQPHHPCQFPSKKVATAEILAAVNKNLFYRPNNQQLSLASVNIGSWLLLKSMHPILCKHNFLRILQERHEFYFYFIVL